VSDRKDHGASDGSIESRKDGGGRDTVTAIITRTCRDCAHAFDIAEEEQRFLADLATDEAGGRAWLRLAPPRRSLPCRRKRRRAREAVVNDGRTEQLACPDCGREFLFEAGEKSFFAACGVGHARDGVRPVALLRAAATGRVIDRRQAGEQR
jgi:hypothetical protein